ncbi:MAG: transposase [Myxococcales bacterium]|nr:transposase [Myxococcales bacterium]
MTNNQAERSMRPAVLGRKNHHGSKSKRSRCALLLPHRNVPNARRQSHRISARRRDSRDREPWRSSAPQRIQAAEALNIASRLSKEGAGQGLTLEVQTVIDNSSSSGRKTPRVVSLCRWIRNRDRAREPAHDPCRNAIAHRS